MDLNDAVLWKNAADGDAKAEEKLISKYVFLVRICARPYFLAGGDSEDLIQEGMFGLLMAVRNFDPERATQFKTYAECCIRNRIFTAIKSAARNKHTPLNDSISFESPQFDESLAMTSCYLRDPEELIITKELTDEIIFSLSDSLSKFEKEILNLYLEGLSYADISQKTRRSVKSVDNAVQRIRKKLARYL